MLKKKLILQNKLLEEKLNEANSLIASLNDQVAVLNDKIKVLTAENDKLTMADTKEPTDSCEAECDNSNKIDNIATGFTVATDYLIDSEVLDIKNNADSEINDFAVSAVAKIILECTKADMTVSCSNSSSKDDDRNIILGSAEATKARIFGVLNENLQISDAKAKITAELDNYLNGIEKILSKI